MHMPMILIFISLTYCEKQCSTFDEGLISSVGPWYGVRGRWPLRAEHQERPICLPVSLSGLHWAASNACQDCPWSWLRPAKTISTDLNKDFGA